MIKETAVQIKEFKRFKKLIDEWIDLAIEQARLSAKKRLKKGGDLPTLKYNYQ